jgi:hypothetical protein
MDNVFKWNGLPKSIVSDRNWIFTSNMWQAFFKALQVKLRFSSAYHPQSDGQTERACESVCGKLLALHGFSATKEVGFLATHG